MDHVLLSFCPESGLLIPQMPDTRPSPSAEGSVCAPFPFQCKLILPTVKDHCAVTFMYYQVSHTAKRHYQGQVFELQTNRTQETVVRCLKEANMVQCPTVNVF